MQPADVYRLLAVQAVIALGTTVTFWVARGSEAGKAAVFGGAVALLSAWLLGRRVRRASEVTRTRPGSEMAVLYIGAVQRFVLTLVLFAVGMGPLGLSPVPLLAGFALAQLAFLTPVARAKPQADTGTNSLEKWG
jgi:ATP synthase protein I